MYKYMKYYNYQITTSEIPDEITLCINITNCPIHCADCHSKFLWEDQGVELTEEEFYRILNTNLGVSCVCIMGGDADYESLHQVINWFYKWKMSASATGHTQKLSSTRGPGCYQKNTKIAFYSGRDSIQALADKAGYWIDQFNYIKVGPYIKFCGGLDSKTTNQRLYQINPMSSFSLAARKTKDGIKRICGFDITPKFWK